MLCRFHLLLNFSTSDTSKVEEEFLDYQLMKESDIPQSVWQSALLEDNGSEYYRMDILWSHMSSMKHPDGLLKFQRLSEVALLVLTLPHSNAEEERVFSMVTKNKTKFRPNLKVDGTLSSILTIKLANPGVCAYEPTKDVLHSAKQATMTYNQAHCSKNTN